MITDQQVTPHQLQQNYNASNKMNIKLQPSQQALKTKSMVFMDQNNDNNK